MNESKKTFVFVGVAAVMALLAVANHFLNRPTNSADFELVSQPFFPDFTSASQAQSLEVAAVDPETAELKRFSVQNKGGLWRIPSHYDYPAEAAARLATTASSVMGIARESLAGRLAKEHERLGVVDPLSDEVDDPETVGKRISLKDAEGEVVVDYIVGKEAGDVILDATERPFANDESEKYYYVRRPDEQQTYKVKLDIDLSTKFSDWIDPDLLRISRNDLTRILIDNYTLEEDHSNPLAQTKALFKAQGDKLEITRKSSTDAWELAGLDPEQEELQTGRINEVLGVLDEMKIAGVRPKYKYKNHLLLTADLKLNNQPEFQENPQEFGLAISRLQNELDQKGFNLAGSTRKMELVAQHGDLEIGTDKGVVYTLHIGKAVEGDEDEIEIGLNNGSDTNNSEPTEDPETEKPETTESNEDGEEKDASENEDVADEDPLADAKNRYLMVRVSFDETLIVPKPEKPIEPVKPVEPDGYEPPLEDGKEDTSASNPDEPQADDKDEVDEPPADDKPQRPPEFVKYDEDLKAYEDQRLDYEIATTSFETATREYEEKIKEGQQIVDELNQRFGDWYYVISADNLKTLQTERINLVSKKEPPAGETPATPRPDISFPDLPGLEGGIEIPDSDGGETGEPTDSATESTDEAGKSTDEAGKSTDEAGKSTDEAGKSTDEAGKSNDEAGKSTDEAGESNDESDTSGDDAGESNDEASKTEDESGGSTSEPGK